MKAKLERMIKEKKITKLTNSQRDLLKTPAIKLSVKQLTKLQ